MSTLDLVNLHKRFGGVDAVNHINLNVGDGEFLCILGPSGCGKSTALRMVAGFEQPTSGDVQIDGVSVVDMPPNRRPTAMVFQKYTLWPHMKVYENIAFGLQLRHMPRAKVQQKVQESLDLVGLSSYGPRYPAQLSGGEQQRVALARALVLEPKILLLDEPFSNLDALLRVRLREELKRIQRQVHITAIFVTHDQEEALTLADRIAVMSKGRIEQLDKPSAIYSHPQTLFVADFIGAMNLLQVSRSGGKLEIGPYTLAAPAGLDGSGAVTIAIRPEDLTMTPGAEAAKSAAQGATWSGTVEQLMDMGHYRKAIVGVPGVGRIKVYLSKAVAMNEGDPVVLSPMRYLVYADGQMAPLEVSSRQHSVPALS
jgi:putative spermidine/putrescine transport system ATP-binding protein